MLGATDQPSTRHRFFGLPASWVGWLSDAIALLAVAGIFNRRFTGGFRGIFAAWIIAGAIALVAVVWKKERSVFVWIPLCVGVLAAIWAGAEILFPH